MEDLTPSPMTVVVMNVEPMVPNEVVLNLMARHRLTGTDYLFFHAPTASGEALNRLQDATDVAVEEARRGASGILEEFTGPSTGSVKFFALDRQWTGSPYVFYIMGKADDERVLGYRGVDVDASISRSYELLKEGFACELLQMLRSGRPEPVELVNGEERVLKMKDYDTRSSA